MYPTKSVMDYMSEMNRLFPRVGENELFQSPPTPSTSHHSNQSLARSSSSTDTSPDTFPDMTNQYPYEYHHQEYMRHEYREHEFYETPLVSRRHRPIVGRKIMSESQRPKIDELSEWPELLQHTSPNSMEHQYKPNTYYELFPDNKTEFRTPVKTPNYTPRSPCMLNSSPRWNASMTMSPRMEMSPSMTDMSPRMTDMSPRMTDMYPRMSNMSPKIEMSPADMSLRMTDMYPSMSNRSPRMPNMSPRIPDMSPGMSETSPNSSIATPPPYKRFPTPFKEPIGTDKSRNQFGASKMCAFCKKNGETPLIYMTHVVKEKIENKHVVTCPILRSHVCDICGATGDDAHTITYCPVLRSTNNGQPLRSTTITLKSTRIKSNGRRRF